MVIKNCVNEIITHNDSKTHVDNSSMPGVITLIDENNNKNADNGCDCSDQNECTHDTSNPSAVNVDCCNSSCKFNMMNKLGNKDASVSCDVPVKDNYTTTYRNSYTGETTDMKRPFVARKSKVDQIDVNNSSRYKNKIMIDIGNNPRKSSKIMIDCCNSVHSSMITAGNINTDVNQPGTSKKINDDTHNKSPDEQNTMLCPMQINNLKPSEKHDVFCSENHEKPNYSTAYRAAYSGHNDIESQKYPCVPLKRDFNQICNLPKTNIAQTTNVDKNQPKTVKNCKDVPCKSAITTNENSCAPHSKYNNCCCGSPEKFQKSTHCTKIKVCCCDNSKKPKPTNNFTTACSYACIDNLKNLGVPLGNFQKANLNYTDPCRSRKVDEKIKIENNNNAQLVINNAKNTCATQIGKRHKKNRDNDCSNKCPDCSTKNNNNAYTGKITATSQFTRPCLTHFSEIDNKILNTKNVCAIQTDDSALNKKQMLFALNKKLSDDDYISPDGSECVEGCKITSSDKLINTNKSLISQFPCENDDEDDEDDSSTNIIVREPTSSSNVYYSQTKKNIGPINDSIKTYQCPDAESIKINKFVEKSTSVCNISSSGKSLEKTKQVTVSSCKSGSSSLICDKKMLHRWDKVHDSTSNNKLFQKNKEIKTKKVKQNTRCPIFKEVNEWIRNVPLTPQLEKEIKKCSNEAINSLVTNLNNLIMEIDDPKYDEKVMNEIDACLSKISIYYPGDQKEVERFKQSLVYRLFQRIQKLSKKNIGTNVSVTEVRSSATSCKLNFRSHIQSKDVELRICITDWLRSLAKNNNLTENQISQLTDFVVIRINPLLNIPVSTYNHKIILKTALVDIINDLSIGNINRLKNRDVQIHNYAKDFAGRLLSIQEKYTSKILNSRSNYSEFNDCIYQKETAICSGIVKGFEKAKVEPTDLLIEEVGLILMDCYEIPHPRAERDAKNEIVSILQNSANIPISQASHLAKDVMKQVRRSLKKGEFNRRMTSLLCSQARKPCTVLMCSSIRRQVNLAYNKHTKK